MRPTQTKLVFQSVLDEALMIQPVLVPLISTCSCQVLFIIAIKDSMYFVVSLLKT